MSVTKKNIVMSFAYQFTVMIVGIVLPRFVLTAFGSEINGITQSVNQFLSYMVLLEGGIGGVVRAAMYKPLAEHNNERLSAIVKYSKSFFFKISCVFLVYFVILAVVYPIFVRSSFDYFFVFSLILIVGLNTYFNYYFGVVNQILIKADQKMYVVFTIQIVSTILNAAVCILLIKMGAGIHIVKLATALIFIINPLGYQIYINKHYKLNRKVKADKNTVEQKKDGLIHHISYFIHRNTDVVVLTIFTNVKEVSVYSIYFMVVYAIENLLTSISSGIASFIGNLIATNRNDKLRRTFDVYEMFIYAITAVLYTICAVLILPFVMIYTSGVNDVNYYRPVFAYLIVASQAMYCIRAPYSTVASAAGHYKETKTGAYLEAGLNIVISVVLVNFIGIAGVAVGTLTAMFARTVYLVWYMNKHILLRSWKLFARNFALNASLSVILINLFSRFYIVSTENLFEWAMNAVVVSVITIAVFAAVHLIIYKKQFIYDIKSILMKKY